MTAYLDYNATTPLDPQVSAAMAPYLAPGLAGQFGNPSSAHEWGLAAALGVRDARVQIAALLGCRPTEIVLTGSGSEADNLAVQGLFEARGGQSGHVVTTRIEHPAITNVCAYLERRGCRVTYLPVDRFGRVAPADVAAAIEPETFLVSVMLANNETGSIQPVAEIAALAHARGVLVHTDAAQAIGKIAVSVADLGVDLLTVAGHKLYAPKGVGALFVRRGLALEPLVHGGGQERGLRSGTENVPYAVGLGAACAAAARALPAESARLRELRDRLHERLAAEVPGLALNGHPTERLPNTLNVSFPGVDGAELLAETPEVAASTGSACHVDRTEPSEVLLAMGLSRERSLGAVRLSVGRFTTPNEADAAADALAATWRRLTGLDAPTKCDVTSTDDQP